MTYNLQPLITILEQILDLQQTCLMIHDDNKPQLKSLFENAISLQQILEKHPLPHIEISLERQIRDAAHKAEDIIESRVVDQILSKASVAEELLIRYSSADLEQVMQQLDSATEHVKKLVEVEAGNMMMISSRDSSSLSSGASLNPKSSSGSIMVGFDKDLMQLKDRLVGMESKMEIIPIVGMGGAGKTTLARNLFEDPTIVYHFEARSWTTVSQDHNMRTILLSLVRRFTGNEVDGEVNELKDILYKSLFGRRYLIVLDDIWSTKVWDEMRMFFPDNNNGSRVLITTRETNVAKYANSQSQQHEVQLLSESASWNLLRQIVFREDDCPFELELIGRKIVTDCGGLPLALTVIGGLLSNVERSAEVWEKIGQNVKGAIAKSEEGEKYSNIMLLSYKHLPNYLKPCFLYMGAFPEDYEIKGSRLMCLWIAEGFVITNRDKSLEEEAEEYLKGLVERNLLMVKSYKSDRKAKRYIIHDVLRDLCITKGDKDNFLHVIKRENDIAVSKFRRVSSVQRYSDGMEEMYDSTEVMSLARSFLCTDYWSHKIVRCIASVSNLLRVLDVRDISSIEFSEEILQLVNLRYLGIRCHSLPVGISRLVNLQTLIATLSSVDRLPSEIWTISGLRHLYLSDFIWTQDEIKELVQMNKLQTISPYLQLNDSLFERGFLQSIPNIKNLGLFWKDDFEIDFSHLHKLDTLRYTTFFRSDGCRFPPSLRKLTLSSCRINGGMTLTLCGLPNLEVLKIKKCRFDIGGSNEEEWEAREGEEFKSLQFLHINSFSLGRWRADETNFPKLRHLVVEQCLCLEEIPSGIGEIPTLELIEMTGRNSFSAVKSAKQIVDVQQSDYDNYALQLRIRRN